MQNIPIYQALAQAFAAGVDTPFTLMGDGNIRRRSRFRSG